MTKNPNHFRWMVVMCQFLVFSFFSTAQTDSISPIQKLDKLISEEKYDKARVILDEQVKQLINEKSLLEVVDYVYYVGKISASSENNGTARQKVLGFKEKIEGLTSNPKVLRQLHLEMGSFYETIGDSETAIQNNLKALEYTEAMTDAPGELFGLIQSNLGVFYSRTGNLEKARDFHAKATKSYLSDPNTPKESFYMNYNSLGAMAWYQSKMDSAMVFFRKAEKTLKTMENTPWNQYYRRASLQNNMCGVYSILGDQSGAIQEMQKCVKNLKLYLKQESIPDIRREYAQQFLFQAMDNYARLYKEIGDYSKAKEIIAYSFELKKKYLNSNSQEISKSKVLLGQAYLALHEYKTAIKYLDQSIQEFNDNPSPYNHWLGMAHYYKGQANDYLGNASITKTAYEESDRYFKKSLGDYYDEIYIDFTINASAFYAELGEAEKAISMAEQAYDYIIQNQGEKTILEYLQVLNLAEIQYELENYEEARNKSKLALNILKDSSFIKNNDLGKLRIEVLKPDAILTKVKAEYQLEPNKSEVFLTQKLEELQDAISILEEQKAIVTDDDSVSILLRNNNEIFEFAKRIAIELYHISNSEVYLNKVLGLHESMLYNRIRNRLNSQSSMSFSNIPEAIVEQENKLKSDLQLSLFEDDQIEAFIEANTAWKKFLTMLKEDYPKYYQLRYASISKSADALNNIIPEHTTLVRFTYIQDNLYAFILDKSGVELFELNADKVQSHINALSIDSITNAFPFEDLQKLYSSVWQPFAHRIKTEEVIIIPDQNLFNINFEILTPTQISSHKAMASKSLLAKHTISYNYSLFLIEKGSKTVGYDKNFIAFAPEFNSQMKSNYKLAITDSLGMDASYLKLLPQPFTKNLAKISSQLFDGTSFLNENASKQVFTSMAKEHKIIHIGTHAESNNVSPELSRLIFAKNVTDSLATEDNSLYTFEIYNQNLSSNLAILTACETGKPTYQAGEGMISLAHAFNYAGSESMLTSLWKIDEQSSATIIELFYDNISKGMSKNKALQLAKQDYLDTAQGRTSNPLYWAGLVLIGDTSPIAFENNSNSIWYWLIGIVVFTLIFSLVRRQMSKK